MRTNSDSALAIEATASFFPLWAKAYSCYKNKTINHRGKRTILRLLHAIGLRKKQPFIWCMKNGVNLAISPNEGYAPWSVGWTCFEQGCWEPHIERLLRSCLKPGDVAMDIGANIGYFSAVMAQCVGTDGKVWSFEPVPPTHNQLQLCQSLNKFSNMTALPIALGSEDKQIEISYDPSVMGSASIYQEKSSGKIYSSVVDMFRLDSLIDHGKVTHPNLVKIDVEGHERDVILGARKMLTNANPNIIFEYNAQAAKKAGWNLQDISRLLRSCGDYQFYSLEEHNVFLPVDMENYQIAEDQYIDLLASCRPPNSRS